ncbi:class I SAM-dependent methyltransferase [Leptolyngbya sp. FACHB-541]|uniref:class I SAM-dependent methyltransferase n=1 Tax=Leptolyngbya sp. FACHB-541 TaxID=2692810 RepID=UPI0016825895|nr:class I SAM-dependent methyltransferase [Leptolyngbya sp. FACHB-541]MBD2000994.1 class I SAM-dependent methyltransferase [Leptolyngbya sp. FACHB-541]
MVFLCPQHQHDLIPQAHSPEGELKLASEIKDFWNSMFQLFQRKIAEITSAYPNEEDQDKLYFRVRQILDECPEVKETNYRRGVFQDRLWTNVLTAIDEDRHRLEAVYQGHLEGKGELELNPDLDIPIHQRKTNIHRMPGGYLHEPEDSFGSGVLYDHGVFLYGRGWFGPLNDELGQTLIHQVLAQHYPDFQPHMILDLGCSVGHSTLPYASTYPQAQVWGIDLGSSLLRYAIARARVLNQTVHFSQQNAENTEFPDQSFDLVVSHILLHEIPGVARKRVFAESYRLLKPGGMMVHLESKLFLQPPTLAARYFRDTEVWANSEPYLASSKFADFPTYALEAGFAPEAFHVHYTPGYYASQKGNANPSWVAFCGVKR